LGLLRRILDGAVSRENRAFMPEPAWGHFAFRSKWPVGSWFPRTKLKKDENNMTTDQVTAAAIASIAVATLATNALAQKVTIESMPPSVVKTVPACGDTAVSASTTEIKVTFSKDMQTQQMWSWCMQSPTTFPDVTDPEGITYLSDKRTCVLPVKLKPGKTYVIWINTQKQNAFRDLKGNPAVPYLLVFETK
jgi:RNA polymerase sigma-70 factor (ECF subfamily)